MTIRDIVILGAGPCGLSTAIALAKSSSASPQSQPLRITVIELRPCIQTIGGTINITPLGMRYLDYLGAGDKIRQKSISLDSGIDVISLRLGWRLANTWGGIGARRIARHPLVENMLATLLENHSDVVTIQWGRHVTAISETDAKVVMEFNDQSTLQCDLLLGCDGIHSMARRLYVEPERNMVYTGRSVAMGWVKDINRDKAGAHSAPITLPNGSPALRDTAALRKDGAVMVATYYEPSRRNVFLAHVLWVKEGEIGHRDGWKVSAEHHDVVTRQILQSYQGGKVKGFEELISKSESWQFYPINSLPPGGRWRRGRVFLLGDAAHAMQPQGESTGISIEDGVLMARVLERRNSRSLEQMLSDYEAVRRKVVDKHVKRAQRIARFGFFNHSGILSLILEGVTAVVMFFMTLYQEDHFAGDVRTLELPQS
ncbi:hypothetical protein B0I35DRAFT_394073 [Stachybotrys elegans]|uniref:FAD-binding domain-containing protein n=1 Tax=Stachybotrys elegans TaxID=80388 RepID=A0A8K0WQ07_9HYPO|nr:hypothetical protein B0I35DRAFT_394073 [Stachybotrys elegans]